MPSLVGFISIFIQVLQLVFLRLSVATAEGYKGRYQGEGPSGPGPAGSATGPAGSIK